MTNINQIKRVVQYWWIFLLIGLLLIVLSIGVFIHPIQGLLGLTIFLGLSTLLAGLAEVIFSLANRKYIEGWSWYLSSGLLNAMVGFILLAHPGISVIVLPVIIGLWLMIRGGVMVGTSFEMKKSRFRRWGWILTGGILTLLLSLFVILNPFAASVGIMIWMGISIMIAGLVTLVLAFGLREAHDELNEVDDD